MKVCKYCTGIGYHHEWCTRPQPQPVECGWWVGPVWKLGGETCVCIKPEGHDEKTGHECSCGSWFAGCGHPKKITTT